MRRRLLERVLDDRLGLLVERSEDVQRSILDSLRRIFSTVHGDASIDAEYGLPDIGSLCRNMPDSTEQMREAIVMAIERYEPRLDRVRVISRPDADGRVLRFDILAETKEDDAGRHTRCKFTTRLAASGHLVVEE